MPEPDISVPAFMRNYHEVLRNDLGKVLPPLLAAGDAAGFSAKWRDYVGAITVHAAMEDGVEGAGGGSSAMLDHYFDGAANAARFREEHEREHLAQARVTTSLAEGLDALREAFAAYQILAHRHLEHEEDVMMPLVVRLPPPKAPKFAQWCVSAGIAHGGFDHFVAHGVRSLATFGSAKNTPAVATRVFLHSLKSVCSAEQWARYRPIARAAAPEEVWAAVLTGAIDRLRPERLALACGPRPGHAQGDDQGQHQQSGRNRDRPPAAPGRGLEPGEAPARKRSVQSSTPRLARIGW